MSGGKAPDVSTAALEDRRASIAIDLGAESCRVSLLRWLPEGPRIQLVHRFANDPVQRENGLRWDLNRILHGLQQGLVECAGIAVEGIRSLGVDGWAVDYVRLDAAGAAVADPFCYRDPRTAEAQPGLHARLPAERMRELTGLQLLPLNTVYQMFADEPEQRRLPWLNLPEYVLFALGGEAVSELTNASHTQMLGLDGRWCGEMFATLGGTVDRAPRLVAPGTDIGRLRGELAALPAFAQTRLIAPACHDTASAIAAIPDAGQDWAYISSGTWSLVGTVLEQPVNSAAAQAENFTNLRGVDNTVCFHKNVNGMWLLRQCLETWKAAGANLGVPELIAAAAGEPARGYVIDVDDPELLPPGDMPARINAQLRRRGLPQLDEQPGTAPAMASFLFQSLAMRYAEVLRSVAEITGKQLRRLYIMGGGSQNELLNQLTAAATGLEVCRAGTECSTLGNFAVQMATLERGKPGSMGPRPTAGWAARLAPAQQQV